MEGSQKGMWDPVAYLISTSTLHLFLGRRGGSSCHFEVFYPQSRYSRCYFTAVI